MMFSEESVEEIIAHLQQARQYFQSAESAGVLAGPLEQYYSVLAFARAIVLYREPKQREANLKRSHGLEAAMPGGASPSRTTGVQRFDQKLPTPAPGAQFTLTDLISRIPGVKEHYEQAFGTLAHCHYGRVHIFQGSLSTTIWRGEHGLPAPDQLRSSLGMAPSASATVTPNESVDFRIQLKAGETLSDYLPSVVELESTAHVFVERFPGGWSLSRIASYFAASHAMSMLVRYHPTRWAKLVNHAPGDKLIPVLARLRRLIQDDFVRLGLRELERAAS